MAKILSEKVIKDLKLVKAVVISRYWRSWRPFNEAFRRSQTLLRRSVIVDRPCFLFSVEHNQASVCDIGISHRTVPSTI